MSTQSGSRADVGLHVVRQVRGPSGLPVVVVHGTMDRSSSFGRVARHLSDLELVRYDRRGYGRSVDAGVATLDEHVDDLLALVGGDHVAVFGHSLGGVIALIAASQRPDLVRAVLAYEMPTPWTDWWPARHQRVAGAGDPAAEAERFMRRTVGDSIWDRLPARTRDDRRAEGRALRSDMDGMAVLADGGARFDPAAVTVPVISAAGGETTWWHRRAAEELAATLPAGELVVVEGAAHGVHLSHPAATADLVRRLQARGATAGEGQSDAVVTRRLDRPRAPRPVEVAETAGHRGLAGSTRDPPLVRPDGAGPDGDAWSGRWPPERTYPDTMTDRPVNLTPSGPPETFLDPEPAAATNGLTAAMAGPEAERRDAAAAVVATHPRFLDGWARLGQLGRDDIESYAAFRVGYHRGLDRLRANGWRGSGYVRWTHPENRGFLRALHGLSVTAGRIGETDEEERCAIFLKQCDPDWPPPDLD